MVNFIPALAYHFCLPCLQHSLNLGTTFKPSPAYLLHKTKFSSCSYNTKSLISDTLEDFYNIPYPVGSRFKLPNEHESWQSFGNRYESYASDVEGAYEKLANGIYSFLDSSDYLRHLMRSRFTNE